MCSFAIVDRGPRSPQRSPRTMHRRLPPAHIDRTTNDRWGGASNIDVYVR